MSVAASDFQEKYLSVILHGESYGLPVAQIREIVRAQRITPIPHAPAHVKGVADLRGRVIPVLDLRARFDLEECHDERTCIVVVETPREGARTAVTGLIVDRVEEVLTLTDGQIEPVPYFGAAIDTAFMRGLAKARDQVTTLLDIDRILEAEVGLAAGLSS